MLHPRIQRLQNSVDNIRGKKIVTSFLNSLIKQSKEIDTLEITNTHMPVMEFSNATVKQEHKPNWKTELKKNKRFDYILGNFPFGGVNREPNEVYVFEGTEFRRIKPSWADILDSLPLLTDGGVALYALEPNGFCLHNGSKLEEALNLNGYYVNAIFNCPRDILKPYTTIQPILTLISRKKTESVFVAELLDETQAKKIAINFISNSMSGNLNQGMTIESKSFCGFKQINTRIQAEKIQTQFKDFKLITVEDIAEEIHMRRQGERFTEIENAIYIPKVGNSPVVTSITDFNLKHHNYYQVVLSQKALNKYVEIFYKSELGKLELEAHKVGIAIQTLSIRRLRAATIPLPSVSEQKKVILTQNKLEDLKNEINTLESELALNPTSSSTALSRLDDMINVFKELTEADEVYSYIRKGESQILEFKETFSLDIDKQTKEKYLEVSALKTIVAFLNTIGGVLLIGVSDNEDVKGIDAEVEKLYKGVYDKFLLHFKNNIKSKIGEQFYPFIDYSIVDMGGKNILKVVCCKSDCPCYYENKDFYVRTNPATDKLEGPKLVDYVQHHFSQ